MVFKALSKKASATKVSIGADIKAPQFDIPQENLETNVFEEMNKEVELLEKNIHSAFDPRIVQNFQTIGEAFKPNDIPLLEFKDKNYLQVLETTKETIDDTDKGIRRFIKDIDKLDKSTKKSTNSLKKWLNQFTKIMKYRVIRKIIQEIYKALSEGITNIIAFDSKTEEAVNRMASAFGYLKNSIGAMLAPLIQIVEPIVTMLTTMAGDLGNTFAEIFAGANGQTVFAKANDDLEAYQKNLKKTQAIGIDELNILNQDGNGGFTYAEVGDTEVANSLKEAFSSIKDLLSTILGGVKSFIQNDLPKILNALSPVFEIIGYIADLISDVMTETMDDVNKSLGDFGVMIGEIFKFVKEIIKVLLPVLKPFLTFVSSILNTINSLLSSIFTIVGTLFESLEPILRGLEPILEIVGIIFEVIGGAVGGVLQALAKAIETIVKTIKAVFDTVEALTTGNSDKIKGIWENLGKEVQRIWVGVGNFFIRVINRIIDYFEAFVNFFVETAGTIVGWFGVDTSNWHVEFGRINELQVTTGDLPSDGILNTNTQEIANKYNTPVVIDNARNVNSGLAEAMTQALRDSGVNGKISIQIDGRELAKVITKEQDNFGTNDFVNANLNWGV